MRVSLPIMIRGTVALPAASRLKTRPTAQPNFKINSGLIAPEPTFPRIPSVPKYCLVIFEFFFVVLFEKRTAYIKAVLVNLSTR